MRFQLFQLGLVVIGVAFAVKHTDQDVLLVNIPQVNTVGHELVKYTRIVALSYFDSQLLAPNSDGGCGKSSQVLFIGFVS